MKVRFMSCV